MSLLNCFKDILVKPFVANRAVVTLDISILLWLSRLDVLDVDAMFSAHPISFPLMYSGPMPTTGDDVIVGTAGNDNYDLDAGNDTFWAALGISGTTRFRAARATI